jgi:RNA-directed DNA polymerase
MLSAYLRAIRAWPLITSADLWRFYNTAVAYAFKWLNRRGGKRKSFTWAAFGRAIEKLGIAKPRITESRCLQHELVFA